MLRLEILSKRAFSYSLDATSTPLVTDKLIIFGTANNGLVALDKETYEQKWKVTTQPSLVYTAPYQSFPASAIETSPIRVGNCIYIGASDGVFYGVNIETGKLEWRHEVGAPIFGSMAVSGSTVFASDYSGNVYGFTSK